MKYAIATILALALLAPTAQAFTPFSSFLSQKEAKREIGKKARTKPLNSAAKYYTVYGCHRVSRGTVKCEVTYEESDGYECRAIYRAKVYPYDLKHISIRVVWNGC